MSGSDDTLYATTDAGHPSDANSAFKVTITDPSTGAYTFTLLHAVDHPLTDDSADCAGEDRVRGQSQSSI